jgi:hypothetical protein
MTIQMTCAHVGMAVLTPHGVEALGAELTTPFGSMAALLIPVSPRLRATAREPTNRGETRVKR